MAIFRRNDATPVVVGHRGVRRPGVAENTPEAFALAYEAGAQWVELDARRSADGVAVVFHNGCTPDGVPVVAQTAAQLAEAHGVCTLTEALASLPDDMGANVEVKNLPGEPDYDPDDAIVATVVADIDRCGGARPLLLSSFNPMTVSALHRLRPDTPTGLIHWSSLAVGDALEIALEYQAAALVPGLGAPGLDVAGVAAAHAAGVEVMVWTVNDLADVRALAAAGVDAICTDDPGGVRAGLAATPPA